MAMDATVAPEKKGLFAGLLGSGRSYWLFALVAALIAVGGALSILGKAAATTTYYVLGQPVAARTQITPSMLVPVTTSVGGQPRNALDVAYVRDNPVFALTPLRAGDVVSTSVAGPLQRINANLPADFVAASFAVPPENAVAGKVRAGDYIDVIAESGNAGAATGGVAKVVLSHVLVLDVTVAPQTITQAATSGPAGANLNPGPESAQVRGGIPSLYVVGLSPQDATKLALVRGRNLMVVLSGNQPAPNLDVQTDFGSVFTPGPVGDSGAGTEKAARAAAPIAPPTAAPAAPTAASPAPSPTASR